MKLIQFKQNPLKLVYQLDHEHNGHTLKIDLRLTQDNGTWATTITAPWSEAETPDEAAKKLGAQLYRISQAIMEEEGNFGKIDLTKMSLT